MPTCSYFEAGPIPRCDATEDRVVPPIRLRERCCLDEPGRCAIGETARSLGRRLTPTLHGLLTLPLAPLPRRRRALARDRSA
jgi:hypothetical protein